MSKMTRKIKFDIITLFPQMFNGPLTESILRRAQDKGLIEIKLYQLRDYATDKHKTVDDTPCGGGAGMVLRVDVVDSAISNIKNQISKSKKSRIILLAPSGQKFDQQKAIELSKYNNLILVCGHYEGFDQRIHEHLVDEEISIGDYVLTGGELPAMVMIDAISRMIPGVIKEESAANESFMPPTKLRIKRKYEITNNLNSHCEELSTKQSKAKKSRCEKADRDPDKSASSGLQANSYNLTYDYPVYTRPIEYKGWKVPEVLLSGDHKKIEEWREKIADKKGV